MQPTYYKTGTTVGRYWKEMLTLISDAVMIYDDNGVIHFANQSAMIGLNASDVADHSIDSLGDIMDRFKVTDVEGKAIDREQMPSRCTLRSGTVNETTLYLTAIDGKMDLWLHVKAFPIFDTKHKVQFVVVIFNDISISKTTEASLKDSNRRMMGMLESFLEAH